MSTDGHTSSGSGRVTIKLYASRLKNVAGIGKGISDPYAVVTLLAGGPGESPQVLGKTEVIKNDLNPAWTQQFAVEYQFGSESRINVNIFDEVRKTGKHISMGSAGFELGEILGARGNVKAKKLKPGGVLFVRVTPAAEEDYGRLHLQFKGHNLDETPTGGGGGGMFRSHKPDGFFILSAQAMSSGVGGSGNRMWHPVYRSEVIKKESSPCWKSLDISVEKLCGGDGGRAIQLEVYDWDKKGSHKLLGKSQTTLNGLLLNAAASAQQEANERFASNGSPDATTPGMLMLAHKGKEGGMVEVRRATVVGGNMANVTPNLPPPIAPPMAFGPSDLTVSAIASGLPPPVSMQSSEPSMSSFPIAMSSSASSLPPPIPPPAFDASMGPVYDPVNKFNLSRATASVFPPVGIPGAVAAPEPAPRKPKFVDYLSGGIEISLSVAIDFTGSNGDPRKPGTLHYIHPDGQLNDYEKALTAVGSIVARYDADQRFPVYGFGAKYGGVIQHCFQVGGAPEMMGMKGVLEGYRSVFSTGLTMSSPTVFAEVIQYVAVQAQQKMERNRSIGKQSYSVLLILTDGAVSDVEQTKGAIKYASSAPLSIVIVGVGNADFSRMKSLDNVHKQYPGTRDIVKFVEFSKFRNNRQALTRETLDEIPNQVVEYFFGKGIMPLAEVTGSKVSVYEEDYDENQDLELNMTVQEDGRIQLDNSSQAVWDAQTYGTAAGYMLPGAVRPSAPPAYNPASLSASHHYPSTDTGYVAHGYAAAGSQPTPAAASYNYGSSSYGSSSSAQSTNVYNPSNAQPTSPGRNLKPYVKR